MSYRTHWDENGDETVELDIDPERLRGISRGDSHLSPFPLPANYREREVKLAFHNIVVQDADRREMPVSRNTLHLAIQEVRKCTLGFGRKFKRDPRRFSSTPKAVA